MKALFHPDSFLMQLFGKIADFFLVSFFVATLCLPVITAGAAFTAAHKVMQNMCMDNPQPVIQAFFQSFTKNFKQATLFWLLTLLIIAVVAANYALIYIYKLPFLLYIVVGIIGVAGLGTMAFAFPLVARYENTFGQQFKNAFFLSIGMLPRTICVLALTAVPVLVAYNNLEAFFQSMYIWGLQGIGLLIYLQARLICPVLARLEQNAPAQEKEVDANDCV